ncbi:hypothetical protein KCU81_g6050, partial [Aureobasidium melanogenum]|uniref:Uncharacterized protein n=1 Tax=Aureobasidium melanogenum (strain CBS 110374) TaxID=1043003 RepID=A0A074WUC3_AURM1
MNNQNTLPLRPHRPVSSSAPVNNLAPPQPSQPTSTVQEPKKAKRKLRAQIFAKLSLVKPKMKAAIVTSITYGECYAHIIDEEEKVRYSSMAQESIKAALKVLLALVEEDVLRLGGAKGMKEVELGESDGEEEEEEVDYEIEAD